MQNSRQEIDFIVDLIDIGSHGKLVAGRNLPRGKAIGRHASAGDILFPIAPSSIQASHVLDQALLPQTMPGHDLVYANLVGDDMDDQANSIIAAMRASGVERVVFVLSMGIYDEVPGKFAAWNNATLAEDLKPFRRAADAIEASGLAYTIVRPAWMTDEDEVDYELTTRHAPFKGTVVSRKSVADLIAGVIEAPDLHRHANLGVNKPNTDGDKPYFM